MLRSAIGTTEFFPFHSSLQSRDKAVTEGLNSKSIINFVFFRSHFALL